MFSVQGLLFRDMGVLRLYKKFYCIADAGVSDIYSLITPTSLSAATYVAGTGGTPSSTLIETGITLVEEEPGIFYADLTATKYSSDITYDLAWYVQYTPTAPNRRLVTRFRIKPFNIANQLDFEISKVGQIDYEISDTNVIEYEVLGTYN